MAVIHHVYEFFIYLKMNTTTQARAFDHQKSLRVSLQEPATHRNYYLTARK
jgi:hypothetical protein